MFGDDGEEKEKHGGRDAEVSLVGSGMVVEGDCRCDGSLRVDGRVQGTIRAGKSVVVGEDGEVEGDVISEDAVVVGRVVGTIRAGSRAELKEGCRVEGDIHSPSVRLEEGGRVDGELRMSGDVTEARHSGDGAGADDRATDAHAGSRESEGPDAAPGRAPDREGAPGAAQGQAGR